MGARRTPEDRQDRLRSDRHRIQPLRGQGATSGGGWIAPRQRHCWVRKTGPRGEHAMAGIVLGWRRTDTTSASSRWVALVAVAGEAQLLEVAELPASDIKPVAT